MPNNLNTDLLKLTKPSKDALNLLPLTKKEEKKRKEVAQLCTHSRGTPQRPHVFSQYLPKRIQAESHLPQSRYYSQEYSGEPEGTTSSQVHPKQVFLQQFLKAIQDLSH
eukprot:TRINITY_DN365_c0_g1_i7.p3 TRINITY_DN365_c0_g1~~TRINITY_DN365_c0_g1_i7.p3  ORF type:complete len:109 (-),score=4.91 TRINITY_DN365_c0_g1_i7:61-387(-)